MGLCESCLEAEKKALEVQLDDEENYSYNQEPDLDLPHHFTRLYKLHVGKVIGVGTTSRVYVVRSGTHQKDFACKRIDKKKMAFDMNSELVLSQLRRETEILRKLDHPSIVKFHDVIETKRAIFIMMEYVSGSWNSLFNRFITILYFPMYSCQEENCLSTSSTTGPLKKPLPNQ